MQHAGDATRAQPAPCRLRRARLPGLRGGRGLRLAGALPDALSRLLARRGAQHAERRSITNSFARTILTRISGQACTRCRTRQDDRACAPVIARARRAARRSSVPPSSSPGRRRALQPKQVRVADADRASALPRPSAFSRIGLWGGAATRRFNNRSLFVSGARSSGSARMSAMYWSWLRQPSRAVTLAAKLTRLGIAQVERRVAQLMPCAGGLE